jgi:exosortase E/protease (VPEID-CTERM system)
LPRYLLGRFYLFPAVLTVDCLLVSVIPHNLAFLGPLASTGIVAYAVFLGLGYSRLEQYRESIPFSPWFFSFHLLCILAVIFRNLAALNGFGPSLDSFAGQLIARAVLLLGIALLAVACIPLRTWIAMVRSTSPLWLFACLAGAAAWCLRYPFQSFWNASSTGFAGILQIVTFNSVLTLMRLSLPGLLVDPATFTIGTDRFAVIIARECSGMEGLGLVLVFTVVWLAYFRKESRFPQALLLIPCALICVWALNIVRICSLILIGNAGAPDVAMVGFHSQAGWIAFTAVAFTFSMATQRLSWVRRIHSVSIQPSADSALAHVEQRTTGIAEHDEERRESPATPAYLIPFLAILGSSLISKAASGYFEWLYPIRFLAAAIALWHFRSELKKLDWRFGLVAPLTGGAIFLVWIAPALVGGASPYSPLGAALAELPPLARVTWIAFRIAAAGITVPIAEELAFRGYLSRRIVSREFDEVPFSSMTMLSIGVSSVLFGLLYGQHWIVGMIAGVAYAAVLKGSGRMGDAVAAHAASNLLLATWVLFRGDWAQW